MIRTASTPNDALRLPCARELPQMGALESALEVGLQGRNVEGARAYRSNAFDVLSAADLCV